MPRTKSGGPRRVVCALTVSPAEHQLLKQLHIPIDQPHGETFSQLLRRLVMWGAIHELAAKLKRMPTGPVLTEKNAPDVPALDDGLEPPTSEDVWNIHETKPNGST